jgi:hypothetical protein
VICATAPYLTVKPPRDQDHDQRHVPVSLIMILMDDSASGLYMQTTNSVSWELATSEGYISLARAAGHLLARRAIERWPAALYHLGSDTEV